MTVQDREDRRERRLARVRACAAHDQWRAWWPGAAPGLAAEYSLVKRTVVTR